MTTVAVDPSGKTIRRFDKPHPEFGRGWSKGDHLHFRNWQEAMRTRDRAKLTAEIVEGHLSSALCHTGMISHRLGQKLPASRIRRQVADYPLLSERFEGFCEHLVRSGIDPEKTQATLGPWLAMDAAAERFLDAREADAVLTREYRSPFVVPQIDSATR